jgi:hypothetical protein
MLLDQYTLLHAASGVIAYFFGIPFIHWNMLHLVFEVVENTSRGIAAINTWPLSSIWPGGKPYADAIINRVGDSIGALIGWAVSYILDQVGIHRGWYTP